MNGDFRHKNEKCILIQYSRQRQKRGEKENGNQIGKDGLVKKPRSTSVARRCITFHSLTFYF